MADFEKNPLAHLAYPPYELEIESPPRPKRVLGTLQATTPAKPIRKGFPQTLRKLYLPPSPKRKLPRTGQKKPQPVKRPKLLSTSRSSPTPSLLPSLNDQSPSIDQDDGTCPSFDPFDTGMGDDVPDSSFADWSNLAETVSHIEAQQALRLPAYRSLLLWNPESYARLTGRCYIFQEWNANHEVLSVKAPHWQY